MLTSSNILVYFLFCNMTQDTFLCKFTKKLEQEFSNSETRL